VCVCVLFFGPAGSRGAGPPVGDVGEGDEVAVYSPHTFCRVALERGLKQQQRPCTQITGLGREEGGGEEGGGEEGWTEECSSQRGI